MKNIIFACLILIWSSAFSLELQKTWESDPVFKTPESVNYYSEKNWLLISNINGKPTDIDGNGFISKITPAGKIIDLEWIKGMNAPKGAAIYKNIMVVTDITRIAVIDLQKGQIKQFLDIPGSAFLNDVAVDSKGHFYISDSSGSNSIIYKFNGEKTFVWLSGEKVNRPNGLFIKDNVLYFGNSGDGIIRKADLKTKEISDFSKIGRGIDGLKMLKNGCVLTSDWSGHVAAACKNNKIIELLNTADQKVNAADLEYIEDKSLVIIPTFFDNKCVAYQFTK